MQSTAYLLPLLITALLSALLALAIWQRRSAPGAVPLAVLILAVAWWALAYMFSLASTSLEVKLFWANLTFLGIVLVPVSWFTFALSYTGHGAWLSRHRLLLLMAIPLAILAAIWTNDLHGLFRTEIFLIDTGSLLVLEAELGPVFWIHTAYSYALLMLGTLLLVHNLFQMSPAYRHQAGGLLIGLSAPWIGNILYLSGLSPFPYLDLTPFALLISGLALSWELLRFGLFELVPIAHSTVFQSMEDGVIVLDGENRIVDINPVALALINQSIREVIGQPVEQILSHRADIIERYAQMREAHEELMLQVDTKMLFFDLRISPIYDRNNVFNGRVVVLHDITERRRTAAELQRQNEELTVMANENAQLYRAVQEELAERKQAEVLLSLAKEAAEVASRAKSHFLRNMSHELRTPLTAILGYADLLEFESQQSGYDDVAKDVAAIQLAGRHLLHLINNVLDITRIEAEKLDLQLESFELDTLVHQLVATVKPLVERNGNVLQVECSPEVGSMYADIARVRQVLLNVLGNAAKFTQDGIITLRVLRETTEVHAETVAFASHDPACISFEISDTGPGISLEQQELLFREFVLVDKELTAKHGGSGLGLAISYRLCHLMGGDIYVTSALGKGATFTINLPAHVVLPAAGAATKMLTE
jgi:PAS domain S-box-containing protein